MTRAAVVFVLVTIGCYDGLRLARGTSNARPYGQFRRRRSAPTTRCNYIRTTSFIAPVSSPPTRERDRSTAPASSAGKAPWAVASWVGPRTRRQFSSERPWESNNKPHHSKGGGGSCTAEEAEAAEQQAWSTTSGVLDASGGGKEAGTIGGLALPRGVNTASRITAVRVDNLAMVESVSIEVS